MKVKFTMNHHTPSIDAPAILEDIDVVSRTHIWELITVKWVLADIAIIACQDWKIRCIPISKITIIDEAVIGKPETDSTIRKPRYQEKYNIATLMEFLKKEYWIELTKWIRKDPATGKTIIELLCSYSVYPLSHILIIGESTLVDDNNTVRIVNKHWSINYTYWDFMRCVPEFFEELESVKDPSKIDISKYVIIHTMNNLSKEALN